MDPPKFEEVGKKSNDILSGFFGIVFQFVWSKNNANRIVWLQILEISVSK